MLYTSSGQQRLTAASGASASLVLDPPLLEDEPLLELEDGPPLLDDELLDDELDDELLAVDPPELDDDELLAVDPPELDDELLAVNPPPELDDELLDADPPSELGAVSVAGAASQTATPASESVSANVALSVNGAPPHPASIHTATTTQNRLMTHDSC
jgi:hypothetical protein